MGYSAYRKFVPELNELYTKAVRPTVTGRKTDPKALEKFESNMTVATEAVARNKGNLVFTDPATGETIANTLPSNLRELADGIGQTKQQVYKQYKNLSNMAADIEPTIELDDIVKELEATKKKLSKQAGTDNVIAGIQREIDSLQQRGTRMSIDNAEASLQFYNNRLQAYYRSPNPNDLGQSFVDALVANNMRKKVDTAIETALDGGQYKQLKRIYGALSSVQDDVVKRAIVDARKNVKGFFDLSEIFSAGDVVR